MRMDLIAKVMEELNLVKDMKTKNNLMTMKMKKAMINKPSLKIKENNKLNKYF